MPPTRESLERGNKVEIHFEPQVGPSSCETSVNMVVDADHVRQGADLEALCFDHEDVPDESGKLVLHSHLIRRLTTVGSSCRRC